MAKDFENSEVVEDAMLVITSTKIGVTNDMADVLTLVEDAKKDGSSVAVIHGEKKKLLAEEHRMLCYDMVSTMVDGNYSHPYILPDYNIVERETGKQLFNPLRFLV